MIEIDALRGVICCPNGCQDERHCSRNMKHIREAADAVARLVYVNEAQTRADALSTGFSIARAFEIPATVTLGTVKNEAPKVSFMWGVNTQNETEGVPLGEPEPRARAEESPNV